MNLQLKLVEFGGDKAVVLCDENGEILPGQTQCVVKWHVNDTAEAVVTFLVDGERVKFGK